MIFGVSLYYKRFYSITLMNSLPTLLELHSVYCLYFHFWRQLLQTVSCILKQLFLPSFCLQILIILKLYCLINSNINWYTILKERPVYYGFKIHILCGSDHPFSVLIICILNISHQLKQKDENFVHLSWYLCDILD